jgi:hypothetical protein
VCSAAWKAIRVEVPNRSRSAKRGLRCTRVGFRRRRFTHAPCRRDGGRSGLAARSPRSRTTIAPQLGAVLRRRPMLRRYRLACDVRARGFARSQCTGCHAARSVYAGRRGAATNRLPRSVAGCSSRSPEEGPHLPAPPPTPRVRSTFHMPIATMTAVLSLATDAGAQHVVRSTAAPATRTHRTCSAGRVSET